MPPNALVVVGASAGGVEALRALVAGLPGDLPAAVLVVLHIPRQGPSALPGILTRAGALRAAAAVHGERLRGERIFVAPADHHMLVFDTRIALSRGPAENGHRPAVDPLFRSAAHAWGPRTIAVVLSGARDDGTAGADDVVQLGGRLLVQDPRDALHDSMPRSVLTHVKTDGVYPAAELGRAVTELVAAVAETDAAPVATDTDAPGVPVDTDAPLEDVDLGAGAVSLPSVGLACPDCGGGLFELPGEPTPRYRCWVGHVWSPGSLLDAQGVAFEKALWVALRGLDEKAELARRMADASQRRGRHRSADRFEEASREAQHAGRVLRGLIARLAAAGTPAEEPEQAG
ncbi:MAG TPA: chemotaxis protein CheB [Micromonosporaceae bacterium]